MIEDESSVCFRMGFLFFSFHLTVNDEFCRIPYLSYPSVVVCGSPLHLGNNITSVSGSLKSAVQEKLVLFLPDL